MRTILFLVCAVAAISQSCRKIDNKSKNLKPFLGKWTMEELVFTDYTAVNPDSTSPYRKTWKNAGTLEIKPDPEGGEWNLVFFTDSLIPYILWFDEMGTAVGKTTFPGTSFTYVYSDYDHLRLFFWGITRAGTVTKVATVASVSKNECVLFYPLSDASGNYLRSCLLKLRKE